MIRSPEFSLAAGAQKRQKTMVLAGLAYLNRKSLCELFGGHSGTVSMDFAMTKVVQGAVDGFPNPD